MAFLIFRAFSWLPEAAVLQRGGVYGSRVEEV